MSFNQENSLVRDVKLDQGCRDKAQDGGYYIHRIPLRTRKVLAAMGKGIYGLTVFMMVIGVFASIAGTAAYMMSGASNPGKAPQKSLMPLPSSISGHCWSDNGARCLYTGSVLQPLPKLNETHCWSLNGLSCADLPWDESFTDKGIYWWNGTVYEKTMETGNGTMIATAKVE
jgi:hypothetical protein